MARSPELPLKLPKPTQSLKPFRLTRSFGVLKRSRRWSSIDQGQRKILNIRYPKGIGCSMVYDRSEIIVAI
jgi:hypothetical protein